MAPVVHFATFPTSEVGLGRFPSLKEAFGFLKKAEGHISSFYGLQVTEEGSENMYFVSIWESSVLHRKFKEIAMLNQETEIAKQFKPLNDAIVVAGNKYFQHEFNLVKGTPAPGLELKTTEFVIIRPKDASLYEKVKELGLKVQEVWDSKGHPAAFSESTKEKGLFLMIVGWSSSTHHLDTVRAEPYASIVSQFTEVGKLNMTHAILEKNN